MKIKPIYLRAISVLLAFILLTACNKSNNGQSSQLSSQSEAQSSRQSENVPSDLTGLESNIETIIKTLDGPAVQMQSESQSKSSGESKSSSQSGQSEASRQSGGSSQQGQSQQQSQTSGASQQVQQPQDQTAKITSIINTMHYQWNNLMPAALKKGANKDLVNNFDNALNSLSSTVTGKNKLNIMMAANRLYAYIPDFYSLFKPKLSDEIKRIRYYSRSAVLNALSSSWTQADSDVASLKSAWSLYKTALGKDQQDLANKLDVSIYELEKVVKERNQSLVNIKGRVELLSTEALEKAAEKEPGGTQSEGGQSSR